MFGVTKKYWSNKITQKPYPFLQPETISTTWSERVVLSTVLKSSGTKKNPDQKNLTWQQE